MLVCSRNNEHYWERWALRHQKEREESGQKDSGSKIDKWGDNTQT